MSKRDRQAHLVRLRHQAYLAQGGRCYWCGEKMFEGDQVPPNHPRACSADHLRPQSLGGKTHRENIVAACRQCNSSRHAWHPHFEIERVYSCGPDRNPTLGDLMIEVGYVEA